MAPVIYPIPTSSTCSLEHRFTVPELTFITGGMGIVRQTGTGGASFRLTLSGVPIFQGEQRYKMDSSLRQAEQGLHVILA
jgi:hypothetical protein